MKSNKTNNIIYLRLEKGEEIFNSIYQIIDQYNIKSGWINGIGAINNVKIGSYNQSIKSYNEINLNGDYELISFMGNISTKENKPFIHAHITISDHNCNSYGGHLFSAQITATGEFAITLTDIDIKRKYDDNVGLYLWEFNNCEK